MFRSYLRIKPQLIELKTQIDEIKALEPSDERRIALKDKLRVKFKEIDHHLKNIKEVILQKREQLKAFEEDEAANVTTKILLEMGREEILSSIKSFKIAEKKLNQHKEDLRNNYLILTSPRKLEKEELRNKLRNTLDHAVVQDNDNFSAEFLAGAEQHLRPVNGTILPALFQKFENEIHQYLHDNFAINRAAGKQTKHPAVTDYFLSKDNERFVISYEYDNANKVDATKYRNHAEKVKQYLEANFAKGVLHIESFTTEDGSKSYLQISSTQKLLNKNAALQKQQIANQAERKIEASKVVKKEVKDSVQSHPKVLAKNAEIRQYVRNYQEKIDSYKAQNKDLLDQFEANPLFEGMPEQKSVVDKGAIKNAVKGLEALEEERDQGLRKLELSLTAIYDQLTHSKDKNKPPINELKPTPIEKSLFARFIEYVRNFFGSESRKPVEAAPAVKPANLVPLSSAFSANAAVSRLRSTSPLNTPNSELKPSAVVEKVDAAGVPISADGKHQKGKTPDGGGTIVPLPSPEKSTPKESESETAKKNKKGKSPKPSNKVLLDYDDRRRKSSKALLGNPFDISPTPVSSPVDDDVVLPSVFSLSKEKEREINEFLDRQPTGLEDNRADFDNFLVRGKAFEQILSADAAFAERQKKELEKELTSLNGSKRVRKSILFFEMSSKFARNLADENTNGLVGLQRKSKK